MCFFPTFHELNRRVLIHFDPATCDGLYGSGLQMLENNISRLGWHNSSPTVMDVRGIWEEYRRARDKRKDRNSRQQEKEKKCLEGLAAGSLFVKFEKGRGRSREREDKIYM